MCDILKAEFKLKNFGLHHDKPESFVTAQWRWHPGAYLAYRVIVALYSIACFLAVTLMSIGNDMSIMVFLTIWTYLVLALYLIIAAVIALVYWFKGYNRLGNYTDSFAIETGSHETRKHQPTFGVVSGVFESDADLKKEKQIQNGDAVVTNNTDQFDGIGQNNTENIEMNWFMKLSWVLADMVYVFAIVVSLVYFIALFPLIGVHKGFGNDLNMHAFNSVIILIDAAIVARPVRLLHVIYPIVYGLCYIIFSVIFWSQDKERNVLYPGVLDWNHPGHTSLVISCLAIIGIPFLQLVHFGFYRLRLMLYRKLYDEEYY